MNKEKLIKKLLAHIYLRGFFFVVVRNRITKNLDLNSC